MEKRIQPRSFDQDGYSHDCKACMARSIVDESVSRLERNLRHVFREHESLIKASNHPLAVKVRKRSGLDFRGQRINDALNELLGAFYDIWAELEGAADHERSTVKSFRRDRAKGGNVRHSRSPASAAKAAAQQLWPESNRKGWTAAQFHTALTDGGHRIAFDTARKWLTSLRKTGAC